MSVENTSTIPIKEQTGRQYSLSNTDSFPYTAWTPDIGKRVAIYDINLEVLNKSAGQYIGLAVQVYRGAAWRTIFAVAAGGLQANALVHNFGGRVQTNVGDGSEKIRVVKMGNSTSWDGFVLITGEE